MRRRRKALEKGDAPVKETMSKKGIIAFPSEESSIKCSPTFRSIVCKMTKITWARCKVKAWGKRRQDSERGQRVKAEKETEETMLE